MGRADISCGDIPSAWCTESNPDGFSLSPLPTVIAGPGTGAIVGLANKPLQPPRERNEEERGALRQEHEATRAMYSRWQQDLLAAVPTARIVDLPGANLHMFLSNEADIIKELRAFASAP